MKIAIRGHGSRGEEVIQILENLGGINRRGLCGCSLLYYYIDYYDDKTIHCHDDIYVNKHCKKYTLEEFEKEFPFKVGDKVIDYEGDIAIITGFAYIEENLGYSLQYENGRGTATPRILTPYKEMKKERNITLTLDKAKEWYLKGGELKEIALQAFTEKELNPLPRSWKEFYEKFPVKNGECWIGSQDAIYCATITQDRHYKNWITSKKSAEAHLAMIQLEQLRNCWWAGWEPIWDASNKYAIKNLMGEITIIGCSNVAAFLVFPTREMAEEFLKCFRDLIEQAGDLI